MNRLLWLILITQVSLAYASPRLSVDLDIAGSATHLDPATGPTQRYDLTRSQLGFAVLSEEGVSGHMRFDAVRSAPENAYIGLEGESYVPRVLEAFARLAWSKAQWKLGFSAGLVPNTWILSGNESFGYRPVRALTIEELGAHHRSDTGFIAMVGFGEVMKLNLSSLAGEGFRYRERNDEKNTLAHLQISPLVLLGGGSAKTLLIEGLYQHGSQGLLASNANRIGVRLSGGADWLYAGLEWHDIHGLADNSKYRPTTLSAWLRSSVYRDWIIFGRYDQIEHASQLPDAHETDLTLGLGIDRSSISDQHRWQLLAGYNLETRGANSSPLAGETVLDDAHVIWLVMAVQATWTGRLQGE